ncbi:MAG: zinc-dependent metalloprotease [Bacteroidota bacterium]
MSSDAITYSISRIRMVDSVMGKIKDKYSKAGQSYHEFRNAFAILLRERSAATDVISRYIGGVYVDRSFIGQINAGKPFTPVSYKDQKRAMDALANYLFSVKAFGAHTDLYNYLQMQRRGFGFFSNTEDPKIHELVLYIQSNALTHLLHATTLKRITDAELYGDDYKLPEFFNDLTNSIFKEDLQGKVTTFRQNLQKEYVNKMISISKNSGAGYDYRSETFAFTQVKNIEKSLKANPSIDEETKAHRNFILFKINKALEEK